LKKKHTKEGKEEETVYVGKEKKARPQLSGQQEGKGGKSKF